MNQKTSKKGFTIIEVVLVLAIAGLIFLVVFLALPALQRGQRDTQRKQDLSRMMSQVTQYQSNTQGALPTTWDTTFKTNYLTNNGQQFKDPQTGTDYTILASATVPATAPTLTAGNIRVYTSAKCDTATWGVSTLPTTNNRVFAAIIFQEQGGFTCQSN